MIIQNVLVPPEAKAEAHKESAIMEAKKYLVVKNHVREIDISHESMNSIDKEVNQETEKPSKKNKKRKHPETHSSSVDDPVTAKDDVNEISRVDLEELRTVYNKCKRVLLKIESKYGHLLNLDKDECVSRKWKLNNNNMYECKCSLNSKVVFNDDGQTTQSVSNSLAHHICPSRLQTQNKYYPVTQEIQIESEDMNIQLPDTIQQLEEMLKDMSIPMTLRNKIIEKIKFIRHEKLNMIRYEKQYLIEKMKSQPDEFIDFKGTNFSSILGYPTKPT